MRVTEHLEHAEGPLISFEIIPPLRGGNLRELLKLIEDLARHEPPFIDITSHAAQIVYEETKRGIERLRNIASKEEVDGTPLIETADFARKISQLEIDLIRVRPPDVIGFEDGHRVR